ncbi:MAG: hypothetical protein INR62_09985 [Rhodospirillales bacterium]|nr:hypothetical protein [Acetobacter sp.]
MTELDVKTAVILAKQYVADLFANEGIINLGLEEAEHDDSRGVWLITLGFSRPWTTNDLNVFAVPRRDYKIIAISDAGQILSVKNRESANAG